MDEGVMDFVGVDGLASQKDWLQAVKRVLGDSDFDDVLVSNLSGGIRIDPLYTKDSLPSEPNSSESGPSSNLGAGRRSSNISGTLNGWEIRQRHWLANPKKTNQLILSDLERGVSSVELIVGEVQEEDLEVALSGVLMEVAAVAPVGPGDNVETARSFLSFATASDVGSGELLADLSCDPIGQLAFRGGIKGGIEEALGKVGDLATDVSKEYQHVTTARIDGTPYAEAGADSVTELAAIVSTGIAYVRALSDAGLDIEDAFRQILTVVSVGPDQFLDIAKIRALREIWRYVGESCGVEEVPARIQAATSLSIITEVDPWVNILRTTVGCFAAAVGGADLITVAPFDSGIGVPDDFGLRLARNTHLVLMEEANIHRVIDPVGGSWYIESLTDQLAGLAWERFQTIERNGGIIGELKAGTLQDEIQRTKIETQRKISEGEKIIVGVNEFRLSDGIDLSRDAYPGMSDDSPLEDEVNPLQPYRQDEGFR